MEEEINHLIQAFDTYKVFTIANQKFYDGVIGVKKVSIVQSGIGKVNAAIASSLLIERFSADQIINTGSAGSIKERIHIGELVISETLAYHDVDNRVFDYDYGQIPQMPSFYKGDQFLNKKAKEIAIDHQWDIHSGLIVTGDSFVSSSKEINDIKNNFPQALVTEMEGAAVAQTAYQFDTPCLIIRAVSDSANEKAELDFDEFVVLAGKKSAQLVLELIKNI